MLVQYTLRRVVSSLLVLFATLLLAFLLMHLSGGDPAELMLPMEATQQQVDTLRAELGTNLPLPTQFGRFLARAVHGDFGTSIRQQEPALPLVVERLPASFELMAVSACIMLVIGIPLGVMSANRRNSIFDFLASTVAVLGQSIPTFWLGMMLIFVFSVHLHLLPYGGIGGINHLILPSVTLGMFSAAVVARLTRSGLVEALTSDYVRTAQAKGLARWVVLYKHALKNAGLPVITMIGIQIPTLLAGAIVTETVFSYPGVARLAVEAVDYRDVPVVQAFVLVFAIVVICSNLVVDLLYFFLDPRIRFQ